MEDLAKTQVSQALLVQNFWSVFQSYTETKLNYHFVQASIELVQSQWNKFCEGHSVILKEQSSYPDHEYFVTGVYNLTQLAYLESLSNLRKRLEDFSGVSASSQNNSAQCCNPSLAVRVPSMETKLPAVNIPKFSGNYMEWLSFKDLFTSLVHNNEHINNVQKLHHLKTNLSGEANDLIKNISITDSNYIAAWELLTERYENVRVITQSYLEAIISAPTVQEDSVADFKRLVSRVLEAVKGLSTLGRPVDTWDDWLVYIVTRKLDNVTRKDWETTVSTSNDLPSFQSLQTFLLNRIRIMEAVNPSNLKPSKLTKQAVRANAVTTEDRQSNTSTSTDQATQKKCPCCYKTGHFIYRCTSFLNVTIPKRWDIIRNRNLCHNCLREGHLHENCQSTFKCKSCGNLHHSLLHRNSDIQDGSTSACIAVVDIPVKCLSQPMGSDDSPTVSNLPLATMQNATLVNVSSSSKQKSVLLPTALIDVFTSDGSTIRFRALLDQANQASFITTWCLQRLKLPKFWFISPIIGIGGASPGNSTFAAIIRFQSTVYPRSIFHSQALILPKLVQPMVSTKGNPTWHHIENLSLADPDFLSSNRIDIILGGGTYSEVLLDGLRRGSEDQPIAQETSLGWIVSGYVTESAQQEVQSYAVSLSFEDNLCM